MSVGHKELIAPNPLSGKHPLMNPRLLPPARLLLALAFTATAHAATWERHIIDDSSRGADGTRLADVNGDGLPDIATGWEQGGVTRVYLNPGPDKSKSRWPAVTVGRTPNVEDAVFVDLDNDGAVDVVSSCEGKTRTMFVHWAPKEKSDYLNPKKWTTAPLPASQGKMMWMYALPLDIDGRNGIDIVGSAKGGGAEIGWFESPKNPRDLAAWKYHTLRKSGWIMSLVKADMDGDGDPDVVATDRKGKASEALWLENPGRKGQLRQPWRTHHIGGRGKEMMFLELFDLDGDGLQDVLSSVRPKEIAFFKRLDASGRKWRPHYQSLPENAGDSKCVSAGDINLDGQPDLVFSCERAKPPLSGVMWLEYDRAPTESTWRAHDISGPTGVKHDLIPLIDLDGDGDLDAITCEESTNLGVIWYENPTN